MKAMVTANVISPRCPYISAMRTAKNDAIVYASTQIPTTLQRNRVTATWGKCFEHSRLGAEVNAPELFRGQADCLSDSYVLGRIASAYRSVVRVGSGFPS